MAPPAANGTAVAGPSRRARHQLPEEDATRLQFGEFAEGDPLTPTEVHVLLEAARSQPGAPPAPDNKVYTSTATYIKEFMNAPQPVNDSMRAALTAVPDFLNNFEVAQIMYLRPERVEVAVALIPSLERYSQDGEQQDQLRQLLEDVRGLARYSRM